MQDYVCFLKQNKINSRTKHETRFEINKVNNVFHCLL